jgi:uncharacterized protein (TIGR03435 family)
VLRTLTTLCGIALSADALFAQTAWEISHFEAATLKTVVGGGAVLPGQPKPPRSLRDPGRLRFPQISLGGLIRWAYHLELYQAIGPDWWEDAYYLFEAVFPAGTPDDRVRLMGQALLTERLGLRVHREKRETPVYAVSVAAGGLKLRKAPPSDGEAAGAGHSRAGMTRSDWIKWQNSISGLVSSIPELLTVLSPNLWGPPPWLDMRSARPMVDFTGLQGEYEVNLVYAVDPETQCADRASLFAAMERQLGLKVEARKALLDLLVVDHVERVPAEN